MTLLDDNARPSKMFRRACAIFALVGGGWGGGLPEVSAATPSIAELSRRVAKLSGARVDPALAEAAARHARAIARDTQRATRDDLMSAVEREGLADALLVPFSSVGTRREALDAALLAFAKTTARARAPTHVGVALAHEGATLALVAVFSRRLVDLAPLPRRLTPKRFALRGRAAVKHPITALVLGPCRNERCRAVEEAPVGRKKDVLTVEVDLTTRGWYLVELLVDGPRGPETAALWRVAVGEAGPEPGRGASAAPPADQIRADREAAELAPLASSAALTAAAQKHAEAACRAGLAAHILVPGETPLTRARAAGFAGAVTENVALAPTAALAHHNILWSPGHRANVLDPTAAFLGIGIATRPAAEGVAATTCLVEMFGR